MLFSSIPFLYVFLPITLICYFVAPRCLKNTVILVSSLVFYAIGEPKLVILMMISILLGYLFGLAIERFRRFAKPLIILSAVVSLGLLGYYKYADFFISSFNSVAGSSIPLLNIALPIGISFYTFQILSYDIDVYRGDVKAQKNIINFAAYVTMFSQLIAGPIVRYSDIALQLETREHSISKASEGIRRFVLGLAKKILIANALGELCDTFRASGDKSVLFFWIYAVAFTLHIYFDFSGYSDMAIGIGKIFGFDFIENFNYPYISASVTEFWRRWHMSLGSFFRDYVYIPLGGNRVSRPRLIFNIFVVWFLTGMWHGAAWNFIVWGLYFAVLLMIEKLWLMPIMKKMKLLPHVTTLFFVVISFVIFNASSMGEAISDIGAMFGAGGHQLISEEAVYYLRSYAVIFVIAIVGATPLPKRVFTSEKLRGAVTVAEPLVLLVLMAVMTAYLVDGSFNPFLYFRF